MCPHLGGSMTHLGNYDLFADFFSENRMMDTHNFTPLSHTKPISLTPSQVESAIGQRVKVPVAAVVVLGQTIKPAEHQGFTPYH